MLTNRLSNSFYVSLYFIAMLLMYGACTTGVRYYSETAINGDSMAYLLLALLPVLIGPADGNSSPGSIFGIILYVLAYIPSCFYLFVIGYPVSFDVIIFLLLYGGFLAVFMSNWFPRLLLNRMVIVISCRGARDLLVKLFVLTLTVLIGYLAYRYKSTFRLVSFKDVYTLRAEYKLQSSSLSIGPYIVSWSQYLFIPLLFVTSIVTKKKHYILYAALCALFVYGVSAGKSVLFLYAVMCVLYYFLIIKDYQFSIKSLIMLLLVVLFSSIFSHFIALSLARRLIYDPGLMNFWYIKFATVHASTGPGGFISSLLGLPVYDFSNLVNQFNTGLIGNPDSSPFTSSIVQFGYIVGPLIVGTTLFIYFLLLNWTCSNVLSSKKNDINLIVFTTFGCSFCLYESSLFPFMITGGGVILIFILFILFRIKFKSLKDHRERVIRSSL